MTDHRLATNAAGNRLGTNPRQGMDQSTTMARRQFGQRDLVCLTCFRTRFHLIILGIFAGRITELGGLLSLIFH